MYIFFLFNFYVQFILHLILLYYIFLPYRLSCKNGDYKVCLCKFYYEKVGNCILLDTNKL
jgi:hypothetical protein